MCERDVPMLKNDCHKHRKEIEELKKELKNITNQMKNIPSTKNSSFSGYGNNSNKGCSSFQFKSSLGNKYVLDQMEPAGSIKWDIGNLFQRRKNFKSIENSEVFVLMNQEHKMWLEFLPTGFVNLIYGIVIYSFFGAIIGVVLGGLWGSMLGVSAGSVCGVVRGILDIIYGGRLYGYTDLILITIVYGLVGLMLHRLEGAVSCALFGWVESGIGVVGGVICGGYAGIHGGMTKSVICGLLGGIVSGIGGNSAVSSVSEYFGLIISGDFMRQFTTVFAILLWKISFAVAAMIIAYINRKVLHQCFVNLLSNLSNDVLWGIGSGIFGGMISGVINGMINRDGGNVFCSFCGGIFGGIISGTHGAIFGGVLCGIFDKMLKESLAESWGTPVYRLVIILMSGVIGGVFGCVSGITLGEIFDRLIIGPFGEIFKGIFGRIIGTICIERFEGLIGVVLGRMLRQGQMGIMVHVSATSGNDLYMPPLKCHIKMIIKNENNSQHSYIISKGVEFDSEKKSEFFYVSLAELYGARIIPNNTLIRVFHMLIECSIFTMRQNVALL